MKPAVLCVTRDLLPKGEGLIPFSINSIPNNHFHFINRSVADIKAEENENLFHVAKNLPQILGYVVIKCGEEYLTYSRKKGAEARLHGSLSIGFGGHVDITDFGEEGYKGALISSTKRELKEELNLEVILSEDSFKNLLVDLKNSVGEVHVGLPLIIEIDDKDFITTDLNEISSPLWVLKEDLVKDVNQFENWSQILIESFI